MVEFMHLVLAKQPIRPLRRIVRSTIGLILILHVFAICALAASPSLHHAIHPDSDQGDHTCIVTAFAKGQIETVEIVFVLSLVSLSWTGTVLTPGTPFLNVDYRFSLSRGPPSSGFFQLA